MARQIKLANLEDVIDEWAYPIDRDAAAEAGSDVTVVLADGQVNLGETIRESSDHAFESIDDLQNEIMSRLPRRAVGEPYQSEGEG